MQANTAVMLLYVLESKGSSPGRQGFCMAVNANGDMQGSLGGGVMEHKFVELAKKKLVAAASKVVVKKQIHDKAAAKNRSGMICSGEQTIFLYSLHKEDANVVTSVIDAIKRSKNTTLVITPKGFSLSESVLDKAHAVQWKSSTDFVYEERIGYLYHLYIVGGGHCSLALSELMHKMDFYIHLYDTRQGLNTMAGNKFVHEKVVLENYNSIHEHIPDGKNNYIVVMTFGYRTDGIALRSLINKKVKYFGLLGSKTKIDKMFAECKAEGISALKLKNIHAPIGIPIKSQTTQEIAVSIAAEIIKIKNANF